MADVKPTHSSPAASPSAKVAMVAHIDPAGTRWGDLRAIVALSTSADGELVAFERSEFDENVITGIYVDVEWPR